MKKTRQAAALLAGLLLLFSTGCGEERAASAEAELEEKLIALTFDDGPGGETTEQLLDMLKKRDARATFFLIGDQIQGREALVRRMAREGHQVGSHSWSHRRLTGGAEQQEELRKTDLKLREVLGEGDYWLRPPYGFLDEPEGVQVPVILWSVDPRDWESRDARAVTEQVLNEAEPGAIILLHDIYKSSVEAAEAIVEALQAEGYRFVTVRQLLEAGGITPEPGERYRRA